MKKISLSTKVKLAKTGLWFAKHYPKLALAAVIAGAGHYVKTYFDLQHQQLTELRANVVELRTQNKVIIAANKAMDGDMKAIKKGMESFNQNIIEINKDTKILEEKFNEQAFRQNLKKDLPKAENQFNDFLNDYIEGINADTLKYLK